MIMCGIIFASCCSCTSVTVFKLIFATKTKVYIKTASLDVYVAHFVIGSLLGTVENHDKKWQKNTAHL